MRVVTGGTALKALQCTAMLQCFGPSRMVYIAGAFRHTGSYVQPFSRAIRCECRCVRISNPDVPAELESTAGAFYSYSCSCRNLKHKVFFCYSSLMETGNLNLVSFLFLDKRK